MKDVAARASARSNLLLNGYSSSKRNNHFRGDYFVGKITLLATPAAFAGATISLSFFQSTIFHTPKSQMEAALSTE